MCEEYKSIRISVRKDLKAASISAFHIFHSITKMSERNSAAAVI